jgi:hypothetical protein
MNILKKPEQAVVHVDQPHPSQFPRFYLIPETSTQHIPYPASNSPVTIKPGAVRVIVDASNRCIEDQDTIDKILTHLRDKEQITPTLPLLTPPPRAPPETLPLFSGRESASTPFNQQGHELA